MPIFGPQSQKHRATLHGDLILVLDAVMFEATNEEDFAIIDGLRNEAMQMLAYNNGKSKSKYPQSHHNGSLDAEYNLDKDISDAADVVPYPFEWPDRRNDAPHEYVRKMKRFYDLAYRILKKADELGIALEWGGMFKSFFDGPHFQRRREHAR